VTIITKQRVFSRNTSDNVIILISRVKMRGNYVATLHYKATDIKYINIGSAIQKLQQFELFALRVRGSGTLNAPRCPNFGLIVVHSDQKCCLEPNLQDDIKK
jgi:hypothetical protein